MELKTLPVDGDEDRSLLKAAVAQHAGNKSTGPAPFRDSSSPVLGVNYFREVNPCDHLKALEALGVAIHHIGYWNNWLIKGSIMGYWICRNPGKLTLLPLSAIGKPEFAAEHRRWFDYWLKGIDNGVMREPRVRYTIANGDASKLNNSDSWPPKGARELKLHLASGALDHAAPTSATVDTRTVDYDVSMSNRADKGLVYLSAAFDDGLLIVGHPTVRLWVSSTAPDGDFIVYLQDVAPDGDARDITDGRLRASLRALHSPPYQTDGLPWHRSNARDVLPLRPGRPAELWFEMLPTAWQIEPGHRLRIIVTNSIPAKSNGVDLFNETPRLTPAPIVTIHSAPRLRSLLSMPVS
jgi:predicted acyl esterase